MIGKWSVIYYVSESGEIPVRDFLNAAKPSLKAKTLRILLTVSEYGLQSIIPHVRKLSGMPFCEIRIMGVDSTRIIFVTEINKQIILLHAFYKKTQKTPQRELTITYNRYKNYQAKK
ncbi:type II toxin-antitoxin system RelE/ParE family toxin [Candidatus Gottesmanbacteria bacterium]|nr:type II toxin-antitoxin system RelE/ParE family toxin [Candidatus Gottesmanbacteria bacterium]MBI5452683.1 type II toxin-antitoxin system RelE/ParE family toxin [Candidatus Gottesmanbacteria bacterium]